MHPQEKHCCALGIEDNFSFPENYFTFPDIVNFVSDPFSHLHTNVESCREKLKGVFELISIFVYVLIHVRSLSYLLECVITLYFHASCTKPFLIKGGVEVNKIFHRALLCLFSTMLTLLFAGRKVVGLLIPGMRAPLCVQLHSHNLKFCDRPLGGFTDLQLKVSANFSFSFLGLFTS